MTMNANAAAKLNGVEQTLTRVLVALVDILMLAKT
jgi:hypothetical protein